MKIKKVIIGFIFGILFWFICINPFKIFGAFYAWTYFGYFPYFLENTWIIFTSILTFIITLIFLKFYPSQNKPSNKRSWIIRFIFIWSMIYFCGTIVVITVVTLVRGGINILFMGESWLFYATIIPFILTFVCLSLYLPQTKLSNKRLWIISFICSWSIILFSGTIGALIGETIVRGGTDTINFDGTLIWGTIYSFILLPFAAPVGYILIRFFSFIIRKVK
ncbi:hypothetical protein [Chengkuizengella axinellae]|uniref:ABC transporter permease n=1 Tax=Chengkuizengella axinellae TaxID=3064388 RepID=A0ABT9J2X1_9BACL|nr:hypothetical protein [Chengkuizengella sp. 2205SS18-9]MDP5275956.1 hypothetical protein [Chengkuizengella sp. 2205SS18-9]